MDIKGSSAIVTGGAGGFGEATVRRIVNNGAKVVIADLAEEKGEALAKELAGSAVFVKTNVLDEDSVQAAIDAALEMAPLRLSVAVHGGGAAGGRTLNKDGSPHTLEDFRKITDAYLVGAFNVTRLAASAIARSEPQVDGERGLVVNTSSIAGYEGTIGQVAYAAAKGGVIGMTLVLARDLAVSGIRAMTIAPGVFATPAYGAPIEELNPVFGPTVPFPQRMGHPDEYAMLVQQMVENPYLNGEVIRIDGAIRFSPKWPHGCSVEHMAPSEQSGFDDDFPLSDAHALSAFDMKVIDVDGADWAATMEVTPRVVNGSGAIQGGLLATLIDIMAGTALLYGPGGYDQTTTMDMHVTYHAGARVGPVLATAHVLRRGGRSASVRVEVVDLGADRLHVATGMLTFAARHLPEGQMHKASPGWVLGKDERTSSS